jgi:hypothetical protein
METGWASVIAAYFALRELMQEQLPRLADRLNGSHLAAKTS